MAKLSKILLVDDDPDFVDATRAILESKPYEVVVAYDGTEVEGKLKEYSPDLIILDVMMPQKDGYEVCSELKSNPQYAHIPILLLTAVAENIPYTRYTKQMGLETEADDYIDKPVEPPEILKRVERLLER